LVDDRVVDAGLDRGGSEGQAAARRSTPDEREPDAEEAIARYH
jgi:hypothetical protein